MPAGEGRQRLADELADRIQAGILDGTFAAGERLPAERELAARLGANRGSVREALRKLEQLRLVEIQPGSGIRVRGLEQASLEAIAGMVAVDGRPDPDWMRDLLELGEVVAAPVLRLALERGNAADRAALTAGLRRAADPALDEAAYRETLASVPALAARMTRNRALEILVHSIGRLLGQAPVARSPLPLGQPAAVPHFKRLAVAIEARDLESAGRAAEELLRRARIALLRGIE